MIDAEPRLLLNAAGVCVVATLAIESLLSWRNERRLRARGAIEAPGDVWALMAAVYPTSFAAMFAEGTLRGGPAPDTFAAGLALWVLAKALKSWAILSLGGRWSFRVLVLPGASLVTHGPYRWMRHPNYVAVAGELAATAVMMGAPVTGVVFTLAFIAIMRRRVRIEERMLGLS